MLERPILRLAQVTQPVIICVVAAVLAIGRQNSALVTVDLVVRGVNQSAQVAASIHAAERVFVTLILEVNVFVTVAFQVQLANSQDAVVQTNTALIPTVPKFVVWSTIPPIHKPTKLPRVVLELLELDH